MLARVVMQLPEYGCQFHVKEIGCTKRCTESGWLFIRFQLADYVTHLFIYILGTIIKLSMLFQVLGLWLLINLKEYSLS